MSNHLKLLLYILFVVAIFYFIQNRFNFFDVKFTEEPEEESNSQGNEEMKPNKNSNVQIYNTNQSIILINTEVADDNLERTLGLSGRRELGEYNGMLFVFDVEGGYPFWMKDMYIPIDMIFIDSKGFIVDIHDNLQPCKSNYCPNIVAAKPFKYVLEVNAGFVNTNMITEGNSVIFEF